MNLRDALQPAEPHTSRFALPAGLLGSDAAGAEAVFRIPTARQALDLDEAHPDAGEQRNTASLVLMLVEVRSGDDVLRGDEIDVDALPLPVWQFLTTCAAAVLSHGVVLSGEALRAWRATRSPAAVSDPNSSTSPTS